MTKQKCAFWSLCQILRRALKSIRWTEESSCFLLFFCFIWMFIKIHGDILNLKNIIIMFFCILFCRPPVLHIHLWNHRTAQGCHCSAQSVCFLKQPLTKKIFWYCAWELIRITFFFFFVLQQVLQNCCFWAFRLSHASWWHSLWLPATLSLSR